MHLLLPWALILVVTANPRPLPFTFTSDTIADGNVELAQYADVTPLRQLVPSRRETFLGSAFRTEVGVGLHDRLELALGLTLAPQLGDGTPPAGAGTGLAQRLRYSLADSNQWPIDVGVSLEARESEHELAVAGRLVLQRGFDRLRVAANLGAAYAYAFSKQRDFIFDPSLGATYEVTPAIHVGIESWLRADYPRHPMPDHRTFALGPQAYAGPVALFGFGKVWWTIGAFARATDGSHDLLPGEPYGRVWVRTIVGYAL